MLLVKSVSISKCKGCPRHLWHQIQFQPKWASVVPSCTPRVMAPPTLLYLPFLFNSPWSKYGLGGVPLHAEISQGSEGGEGKSSLPLSVRQGGGGRRTHKSQGIALATSSSRKENGKQKAKEQVTFTKGTSDRCGGMWVDLY